MWPFKRKLDPEQELLKEYDKITSDLKERLSYTPESKRKRENHWREIKYRERDLCHFSLDAYKSPNLFTPERVSESIRLLEESATYLNAAGDYRFNCFVKNGARTKDFLRGLEIGREAHNAEQALKELYSA